MKTKNLIAQYELASLVKQVKSELRSYSKKELEYIQLTVGYDDTSKEWAYQTGDNSYSGPCYHYRHWAVIDVYRDSNASDLAKDINSQLLSLICY